MLTSRHLAYTLGLLKQDLMERGVRKPFASRELAVRLAEKIFGIKNASVLEEFDCYSDRAFHIKGFQSSVNSPHGEHLNGQEFVLKILNSCDSNDLEFVEGENETIQFLQKQGFPCPMVLRPTGNSDSDLKAVVTLPISEKVSLKNKENRNNLERCVVRLMSFLPGKPVKEFCGSSTSLFIIGQFVGLASKALQVSNIFV